MTDALPYAIAENTLTIAGVSLRVYVLNDGRRIINAEDLGALFEAFAEGVSLSEEDAETLAREARGASR